MPTTTAFVTLTDGTYFEKARRTILDLRAVGQWHGPLVLICVDFRPSDDFCRLYDVHCVSFPRIDIRGFVDAIQQKPLSIPTHDRREYVKLAQWEKLHVFDAYFRQYDRIVYIDAGLRILDNVHTSLLCVEWEGRFCAPDDTGGNPTKVFGQQLELTNWPETLAALTARYPGICESTPYFLNCIWIYDTRLDISKDEFITVANQYPLWRTNEMGAMNVVLHFHHKVWSPFPAKSSTGKYLFDWCELNNPGTHWSHYCALKYPATLGGDC